MGPYENVTPSTAAADDDDASLAIEAVSDTDLAPAVAALAAATFPLACPPHSRPADIAAFIRTNLDAAAFTRHIAAADTDVLVASSAGGALIGYTLVHHRAPIDRDVAAAVTARPVSEISKMYVLPDHHTRGRRISPAAALMRTALDRSRIRGSVAIWLGVNEENARAQRFYAKFGFRQVGVKTFDLNGSIEHDLVLQLSRSED